MPRLLRLLLGSFRRLLSSRRNLWLENLALRQQLMIFKRRRSWPKIGNLNRLFWLVARRFWSHWQASLILVTPETGSALASNRLPPLLALALPQWKNVWSQ